LEKRKEGKEKTTNRRYSPDKLTYYKFGTTPCKQRA